MRPANLPGDAILVDCAVIGPRTILIWAAKDGAVMFGRVDYDDDVPAARVVEAMYKMIGHTLGEVGQVDVAG